VPLALCVSRACKFLKACTKGAEHFVVQRHLRRKKEDERSKRGIKVCTDA